MDQLLTETVLFYWDCFDLSIQAKNSITGIGGIRDWADKLTAFKSSHPTQCSSSSNPNSVTISFLSHVFFLVSIVCHPYLRFAPLHEETDFYLLAFLSHSIPFIVPL